MRRQPARDVVRLGDLHGRQAALTEPSQSGELGRQREHVRVSAAFIRRVDCNTHHCAGHGAREGLHEGDEVNGAPRREVGPEAGDEWIGHAAEQTRDVLGREHVEQHPLQLPVLRPVHIEERIGAECLRNENPKAAGGMGIEMRRVGKHLTAPFTNVPINGKCAARPNRAAS